MQNKIETEDNSIEEFLNSPEAKNFFPDQIIVYRLFQFPEITIQTILKTDLEEFQKDQFSKKITIIEYNVIPNYVNDPNYIGPPEEANSHKIMDYKVPFILSIKSNVVDPNKSLPEDLENEYLENFKIVFIKLLELIFDNIKKETFKNKED